MIVALTVCRKSATLQLFQGATGQTLRMVDLATGFRSDYTFRGYPENLIQILDRTVLDDEGSGATVMANGVREVSFSAVKDGWTTMQVRRIGTGGAELLFAIDLRFQEALRLEENLRGFWSDEPVAIH